MKILHIINSLHIGGAEKLLRDITPLLKEKGYSIDILLLNGETSFLKNDLENQGIQVFSLGYNNNIYSPFLIFRLKKYISQYDLIHTHLFPTQYWVALAKIFFCVNTILVTTEHSTSNRRRSIFLFKIIDKIVYCIYNQIVAISPQTKIQLQNHLNLRTEFITTVYNGICCSKFTKVKPISKDIIFGIGCDEIALVQVAGFRIEKDQDTVIKALDNLSPKYHLFLVGDGPRKGTCMELTKNMNLERRVHFLGIRSDVEQLLKSADIVIMSSHWEGFGLAALEAMACKKPLIASNVPGLAEIAKGAGLIFEKGNYQELSVLIKSLMSNELYYSEIALRCLIRAELYDIHKTVDGYSAIYKSLKGEYKKISESN